jgi:hypothetical protein
VVAVAGGQLGWKERTARKARVFGGKSATVADLNGELAEGTKVRQFPILSRDNRSFSAFSAARVLVDTAI